MVPEAEVGHADDSLGVEDTTITDDRAATTAFTAGETNMVRLDHFILMGRRLSQISSQGNRTIDGIPDRFLQPLIPGLIR